MKHLRQVDPAQAGCAIVVGIPCSLVSLLVGVHIVNRLGIGGPNNLAAGVVIIAAAGGGAAAGVILAVFLTRIPARGGRIRVGACSHAQAGAATDSPYQPRTDPAASRSSDEGAIEDVAPQSLEHRDEAAGGREHSRQRAALLTESSSVAINLLAIAILTVVGVNGVFARNRAIVVSVLIPMLGIAAIAIRDLVKGR